MKEKSETCSLVVSNGKLWCWRTRSEAGGSEASRKRPGAGLADWPPRTRGKEGEEEISVEGMWWKYITKSTPTGTGRWGGGHGRGSGQTLCLPQKCPHTAARGLGTKPRMPSACLFRPCPPTERREGGQRRQALGPAKGWGWAERICPRAAPRLEGSNQPWGLGVHSCSRDWQKLIKHSCYGTCNSSLQEGSRGTCM